MFEVVVDSRRSAAVEGILRIEFDQRAEERTAAHNLAGHMLEVVRMSAHRVEETAQ